jgi:AcrR family transcriptional regulator
MAIQVRRKRASSYQHGDLRHALIQAGLKLLGEGGVRMLSLRAAAELAGVSNAAPYRHFKDKDALVAAIAEQGFHLLTRSMRQELEASAPAGDVLAALRALAVGYVSFAVENPGYFRTVFGAAISDDGTTESLREAGDEAYHVLREIVSAGIESGQLRGSDPDQVSLVAWSQVHGLGMLIVDGKVPRSLVSTRDQVRALAESSFELLAAGLSSRPAAAGKR